MTEPTIHDFRKQINDFFKKNGADHDVLKMASEYEVKYLRTGSRALDYAMGGGIGIGRSVKFTGELSTLKTYFCQKILANAQQSGMRIAFMDPENSFDPQRAESIGIDINELIIIDRSLRGDEQLDVVEALLLSGNFCVVVDSIASILPKAEAEKRMGDDTVARLAALMSKAMRKLTHAIAQGDNAIVFTNQLRENIGVSFGPKTRAPGGKAVGFYATHRVKFARIETEKALRARFDDGKMKEKEIPIGQIIQATVEKSKVSRPFLDALIRYDLERGHIDDVYELFSLGMIFGIIQTEGQFYTWPDANGEVQKVRWKNDMKKVIEDDPDHFGQLIDPYVYSSGPPTGGNMNMDDHILNEIIDALKEVYDVEAFAQPEDGSTEIHVYQKHEHGEARTVRVRIETADWTNILGIE